MSSETGPHRSPRTHTFHLQPLVPLPLVPLLSHQPSVPTRMVSWSLRVGLILLRLVMPLAHSSGACGTMLCCTFGVEEVDRRVSTGSFSLGAKCSPNPAGSGGDGCTPPPSQENPWAQAAQGSRTACGGQRKWGPVCSGYVAGRTLTSKDLMAPQHGCGTGNEEKAQFLVSLGVEEGTVGEQERRGTPG